MPIDRKDVDETALLARLALSEEESARLTVELGAILGHIDALRELDTAAVEPTTHAVPLDCPLREDATGEPLATERALALAPRREDDLYAVPRIIKEGD